MKFLTIFVIILLTFSGTLELLRVVSYQTEPIGIGTPADQQLGQIIQQQTKVDDLVLTDTAANHPVFVFGGRPSFIAYEGWLWSQGWPEKYQQRFNDATQIYQGSSNTPLLLERHGIAAVVIGPPERAAGANEAYFASNYPLLFSYYDYNVYKISPLSANPEPSTPK